MSCIDNEHIPISEDTIDRMSHLTWNLPQQHAAAVNKLLGNEQVNMQNSCHMMEGMCQVTWDSVLILQ